MFSGTPCQIAGLKSFLGKEYDLLFMVDLICHGVPNNRLLHEHMETLENTYGTVNEIQFRDKDNGWSNVSVSYQLDNEKRCCGIGKMPISMVLITTISCVRAATSAGFAS